MEDWGEEIFTEGVGVKCKNGQAGRGRGRKNTPPTNLLPVKHPITIQDGGIENMIYQAFRSKITPALQATNVQLFRAIGNQMTFAATGRYLRFRNQKIQIFPTLLAEKEHILAIEQLF